MKIGNYEIEKGLLLAPMEGVTDLPFRLVCKKLGADIVYSEFIAAEALIRDVKRSFEKMQFEEVERPVAVQIFGSKKDSMVESAKIIEDAGVDILDINFGCWVKKVVKNNAGAAFLKDPDYMAEVADAVANAVDMPVTCKTRLGWERGNIIIEDVVKLLNDTGIKALSVHCRTRDMGMSGEANWSWINKIKPIARMPIILNGDVKSAEDCGKAFAATNCDAVMIGRAVIGNPFIFSRSKEYLETGIDPGEPGIEKKIETCIEHLDLTIKHKGFPRGLKEFRKHYTGYLKGFFMSSKIRQELVVMESYEEVIDRLKSYRDYIIKREEEYMDTDSESKSEEIE